MNIWRWLYSDSLEPTFMSYFIASTGDAARKIYLLLIFLTFTSININPYLWPKNRISLHPLSIQPLYNRYEIEQTVFAWYIKCIPYMLSELNLTILFLSISFVFHEKVQIAELRAMFTSKAGTKLSKNLGLFARVSCWKKFCRVKWLEFIKKYANNKFPLVLRASNPRMFVQQYAAQNVWSPTTRKNINFSVLTISTGKISIFPFVEKSLYIYIYTEHSRSN